MRSSNLAAATLGLLLAGCPDDFEVTLRNDSGATLVPYPVVTGPPPPHREADPAGAIAPGNSASIETADFNPLYYTEGRMLSLTVKLGLDQDPAQILVRLLEHQVPPGQELGDPALAPARRSEQLFEPTGTDLTLVVGVGADFPVSLEEN